MSGSKSIGDRIHRALELSRQSRSSDYDLTKGLGVKEDAQLVEAAVLIPMRRGPGGAEIILTKRTASLRHHPGQIAFPGGRRDASDPSAEATALREAEEEIGLAAHQVDIVGACGRHQTVTGFEVTPVFGFVDSGFKPTPDAGEVAEVFSVPFSFLMDRSNTRVEARYWKGQARRYYVIPYGPYYIWGATARMIVALGRAWEAA